MVRPLARDVPVDILERKRAATPRTHSDTQARGATISAASPRLSYRIPWAAFTLLEDVARARGCTVSDIVRAATLAEIERQAVELGLSPPDLVVAPWLPAPAAPVAPGTVAAT